METAETLVSFMVRFLRRAYDELLDITDLVRFTTPKMTRVREPGPFIQR